MQKRKQWGEKAYIPQGDRHDLIGASVWMKAMGHKQYNQHQRSE
jgi:hypothetical protein